MSVSFCLPHPVAVSAFMICRGLCACTEMLWMCVLYVSFCFFLFFFQEEDLFDIINRQKNVKLYTKTEKQT